MNINKLTKILIVVFCITCFVIPQERTIAKDYEYKDIDNNSMLTAKQASVIFDFICNKLNEQYAKSYAMENYCCIFSDVPFDGDKHYVDLEVIFDMTLVENPKDSAYVKGMVTELQKIDDYDKKALAKMSYDKLVNELMMNYKQVQKTSISYRISLSENLAENRSLSDIVFFYKDECENSQDELCLVTFDENIIRVLNEDDGAKAMRNMMQMIARSSGFDDEPTYDRTVAVAYAVAHATDVPEFSAANGMGSDCANFVSKCLNAGGIPIDVAGEWRPSNYPGGYAGINWMRTGYYNNGGVIPYMTAKDYFSYVPTATPQIGRILSWNSTSHVALVTYVDQNGTVKYTQHSDTTQTAVYRMYTNATANGTTIYVSNLLWN